MPCFIAAELRDFVGFARYRAFVISRGFASEMREVLNPPRWPVGKRTSLNLTPLVSFLLHALLFATSTCLRFNYASPPRSIACRSAS